MAHITLLQYVMRSHVATACSTSEQQ